MYVLSSHIKIGAYNFKRITDVEINKAKNLLVDTCTIKLPTTAIVEQKGVRTRVEVAKKIKQGDKVIVKLGYNKQLKEEFVGYVSKIIPTTPAIIECEDTTYFLKRTVFKKKEL